MRKEHTYRTVAIYITMLLATIFPNKVFAQRTLIYGSVIDKLTNEIISDALVVLKDDKGNVIDSVSSSNYGQVAGTMKPWVVYINKDITRYVVSVEKKGYDNVTLNYNIKPSKRKSLYECPTIKLARSREKQLDEVVVKATKVKFYSKGDTLVYNADAFQLAEGSMLDALIRQLPGVELKNGCIYANGKLVESLLLNGDDFFKGKNDILLDNLPNYMVNQVKVYDKKGKLSEMVGRDMNDKEFVMDVVLKKQYNIGWIGNVEGGYGSEERYLSRLFGLRFTNQSRISVFGNMNNINETRKPGGNGEWNPSDSKNGQEAVKNAGVDYLVKDRLKRWEVNGNASFAHMDYDGLTKTSATLFTPSRNTFEQTINRTSNSRTSFSTNHSLFVKNKKTQVWVMPNFSYQKKNATSSYSLLGLAENIFDKKGIMDSLLMPTLASSRWSYLTHRMLNSNMAKDKNLSMGLTVNVNQGFQSNDDVFVLQSSINYNNSKNEKFSHYLYEYPIQQEINSNFRNRYTNINPDNYLSYRIKAMYYYWLPNNMAIVPWYRYWGARKHQDYDTYRLDNLDTWSKDMPMGVLPSIEELYRATDYGNSREITEIESEHTTGLNLQWENSVKKGYFNVFASVPLRITTHKLTHLQMAIDTSFRRTAYLFEPEISIRYRWDNWQKDLQFNYSSKASFAPMQNSVAYRYDENPSAINVGGSKLKDTYTHTVAVNFSKRNSSKGRMTNFGGKYTITQNQLAQACIYDYTTGVKSYSMRNINGNYMVSLNGGYSTPIDKKKKWTVSTNTSYRFINNVDFINGTYSEENTAIDFESNRSKVKTNIIDENVKIEWKQAKGKLGVFGTGTWYSATSDREGFDKINAFNFKYGMAAQYNLPLGIGVSSDITMFSRRGYNSHDMNTDDLVWNAQLSKRILKNRATLSIDCFDILHNLSSITYSINGQGTKETYQNVIPRYVMCRLIYRLNIKPKKGNNR